MAKKRAYIYEFDGLPHVFPPVTILKTGDTFELINTYTDKDATWSVGEGPFEGGKVTNEPIPKKGKSSPKTAKNAPFLVATYEVKVGMLKAIAHSDPVIIIDP